MKKGRGGNATGPFRIQTRFKPPFRLSEVEAHAARESRALRLRSVRMEGGRHQWVTPYNVALSATCRNAATPLSK
jgi:hypothetical protein